MKKVLLFLVFVFATANIFSQTSTLIISKISTPPVIDGQANDAVWLALPTNAVEKSIGATSNFSGFFKMCYDENNIYLLVSVSDATPNNNGSSTWQSDCVELFFAMDLSNSETYRAGDCSIRKLASNTQAAGGVEVMNNTGLQTNPDFIVAQTDGASYIQEWRIPINALISSANYNGKSFRFDIQLSDNDGSGVERTGQLFWNSNADDQWTRVLNQGTVELSEIFTGLTHTISSGEEWNYFKGTENPASGWNLTNFSDISWNKGITPFRYGDGAGGTEITDMQNNYSTLYLRKKFNVSVADTMIETVIFNLSYDDGFRMYINDKMVLSKNAPANDNFDQFATATVSDYGLESVQLPGAEANLRLGENSIAIVATNVSLESTDFYFDVSAMLIKKELPLPKAPEVTFSSPGGYFDHPFTLTLSSPNTGDTIIYTIDCSEPATSATKKVGVSPLNISINPDNMFGRPNTPAVVIRAAVLKTGFSSRNSETRSYIFMNKIITQTHPGSPWPDYDVNGQWLHFEVDSNRAKSIATLIEPSLKSIPTVSLVTTNDNLFNSMSGIFVNAEEHGEAWERPASLELIETNNNMEFANNIGLRIRGGYSRNDRNPKHAFRVFYRGEYGKKKLKYPLFGNEGADEFDKVDLRAAQNYSWSYGSNKEMMTYAQDEFCRDVQGKMGRPYTRTKYIHLFLNGLYWGVFEFQERAEANYAATYMGGKKENYDIIKVARDKGMDMEPTDGDMALYSTLYNQTKKGFTSDEEYYNVQGMKPGGIIDTSLNALVDVDNLIDYMMNIFYSANFDAPLSSFGSNNMPNNVYAIKNKKHKRQGFFFMVHDAEHTLNYNDRSENFNQRGVNEDRVNLELNGMVEPYAAERFTPQWLHYKLKSHPEYRVRFADRAYKEFYNGGLFTPGIAEANFRKRTAEVDKAIYMESARWGQGWLNHDEHWVTAVNNTVNKFIKVRTPIVINQLKKADLLPDVIPPTVTVNSAILASGEYKLTGTASVQLDNTNTDGTIYYTLDGSDPRLKGGEINPIASSLTSGTSFNVGYPLRLKTRVLYGTEWSPIREVLFTNTENRENIRITEVQYNPKDLNAASSKDMEFIEFKNIGDKGIDLGGCRIDSAVKFVFPKGTIVNPKGFVVIASDKNDFEYTYWVAPTGVYKGNLSNDNEQIILFDENNQKLIDVIYYNASPWPIKPNGSGYSLVARVSNPDKTEADVAYWKSSRLIYGSPFSDDSTYVQPNSIDNSTLFCNVYPNPVSENLYIKSSYRGPTKVQIADLSGRTISQSNYVDNSSITINFKSLGLKKGVYLLTIQTSQKSWQKKIVYQD